MSSYLPAVQYSRTYTAELALLPHLACCCAPALSRCPALTCMPQAQEGLFWAGACVPAGRLLASDFHALADAADK